MATFQLVEIEFNTSTNFLPFGYVFYIDDDREMSVICNFNEEMECNNEFSFSFYYIKDNGYWEGNPL